MTEPIVFVDRSDVREGKLEELKVALKELADFVDANEPRPIAYNAYLDPEGTTMTVVQVHPDSASMEDHMTAAAHLFPRFGDLLAMRSMDVYGTPSDALLETMRRKAEMLGAETVGVHGLHAGFTRFGAP